VSGGDTTDEAISAEAERQERSAEAGRSILRAVGEAFSERPPGAVREAGRVAAAAPRGTLRDLPGQGLRHDAADFARSVRRRRDALIRTPSGVDRAALEAGLRDPDDGVRATVVRAARWADPPPISLLIPVAVTRGWPIAQQAAVAALTDLLAVWDIPAAELDSLLEGIARMHPPPLGTEQAQFAGLARAIGVGRLAERLLGSDRVRAGAALLLLAQGGSFAVRLVATLDADPSEEVRLLARVASSLIHQEQRAIPEPTLEPEPPPQLPTPETELPPEPSTPEPEPPPEIPAPDPEPPPELPTPEPEPPQEIPAPEPESAPEAPRAELQAPASSGGRMPPERMEMTVGHPETADVRSLLDAATTLGGPEREASERALAALRVGGEELVEHASAVDPLRRPEAVRVIWRLAGPAILPYLPRMAGDSSGPVRSAVLEVVAESADPAGMALAHLLLEDDSSAAVRAAAVRALARAGGQVALEALGQALSDPDPDVRAVAVEAIPQNLLGATGLLPRALEDEDERVWQATSRRLVVLGEHGLPVLWSAIRAAPATRRQELTQAIERDDPGRLVVLALENARARAPGDRALAVELAALAGTPECIAVVMGALEDPDPEVRATAARGLSDTPTPAAVPALARRLTDPHVDVRIEAVRALSVVDDDGVPPALISALKDPEPRVRDMSAQTIMAWRSTTMSRRLVEALSTPSLRPAAAGLLERMGPSAVEPLVTVVAGDDIEAARLAAVVLERMVGSKHFVADLSAPDPADRLRTVRVLGAMGGEAALLALPRALADPDEVIRARAAALLGTLGDARAIPHLERTARGDPVEDVASAARAALRMLDAAAPQSEPEIPEGLARGDGGGEGTPPHLRGV
jgi:HEAT repeat protein